MTDLDEAKSHAARRSDAVSWGLPILGLMILVGGLSGYVVATQLDLWFPIRATIGFSVGAVVAHITGIGAGLVFEKIAGEDNEQGE